MGGLCSYFEKEHYWFPKPLVYICWRQMILWFLENLHIWPLHDSLCIAFSAELNDQFLINNQICRGFFKFYIRVVLLWFQTCRGVDNLFALLQEIPEENLALWIVSLDCNNIYSAIYWLDFVVFYLIKGHVSCLKILWDIPYTPTFCCMIRIVLLKFTINSFSCPIATICINFQWMKLLY